MKGISYLRKEADLQYFHVSETPELILATEELSRWGFIRWDEMVILAEKAYLLGFKLVLEWDVLMNDATFHTCIQLLQTKVPWHLISAVRVQDTGAYEWSLHHLPSHVKLQLILDNGHHNEVAIKSWIAYGGEKLERVILSSQLSRHVLQKLVPQLSKLSCAVELLILGPLLLFYTPRPLLGGEKEVHADSEESPHKRFWMRENRHGMFMYLPKDLSLLEYTAELHAMGVAFGRYMVVEEKDQESMIHTIQELLADSHKQMKKSDIVYSRPTTCGFYVASKTDVLFKKLKNAHISRSQVEPLGEILEVHKGRGMALKLQRPHFVLQKGQSLTITTPEGKKVDFTLREIRNPLWQELESAQCHDLIYIPYIKGMVARSIVSVKNDAFAASMTSPISL